MTKTYEAVLKSSLIMLSLLALAVAGSSVAQAQTCHRQARARQLPTRFRAEGMTELMGGIELQCSDRW